MAIYGTGRYSEAEMKKNPWIADLLKSQPYQNIMDRSTSSMSGFHSASSMINGPRIRDARIRALEDFYRGNYYAKMAKKSGSEGQPGFEYESMSGGAGGAGGKYGSGRPTDMNSLYRRTLDEMRSAQQRAFEANRARDQEIRSGYDRRYSDVMGQLEGMGAQEASDIRQAWWDRGTQTQADLQARGLAGTTIAPTMAAGNTRQMNADQARLQERLRRERLGHMGGMQKEKLDYIERITDAYPDPSMNVSLLRDMAQYNAGLQQQPSAGGGGFRYSSMRLPTISTAIQKKPQAAPAQQRRYAPSGPKPGTRAWNEYLKQKRGEVKGNGFKGATMVDTSYTRRGAMSDEARRARAAAGLNPNPGTGPGLTNQSGRYGPYAEGYRFGSIGIPNNMRRGTWYQPSEEQLRSTTSGKYGPYASGYKF
jgi:hypothetical protein